MPLPPVVPALDALFPAKEELTQFGVCHDSSSLADDSPQWRWLRDITPRFMYRRSVGVLTEDPDKRHRITVGAVAKPTKDDPKPRKGEEMVKLPPPMARRAE